MSNLNLMMHAGSNAVSLDGLREIESPEPTATWHPIAHIELVDQVAEVIQGFDLAVTQQVHAVAADGSRYFGMMEIRNGDRDWHTVLGLRNSHDKQFSAGLVCGSGVLVCDNLCFFGDIKVGRRHTAHIRRDLEELLVDAMAKLLDMKGAQAGRMDAYRSIEITEDQTYPLLIRALDARIITATKLPKVLAEFREPAHPEFSERMNVWRLFNAFTEVLKPRPAGNDLFTLAPKTERLHGLLDAACGL